ncbi:hypothetical protein HDV00_009076 [Rhizophlyctis rosea]|nr:hypothetical protein HDV00_009076 [Rhizophlyctis rosea]
MPKIRRATSTGPPPRAPAAARRPAGGIVVSHHHKHHSHALKKHHKHPKKGHKGKCRGTSISQNLPKGYEPSDLVWDKPSSTLYIASDNGRIAGVDVDGKIKQEYNLGEKFDLEGIALVPWRRDVVYLGFEAPPAILEFNLTSSKITQRWNLTAPADADKNKCDVYLKDGKVSTQKANGIESLVFIATRNSPNGGFFYAGRQCDARVFVYDIPIEGGNDGKVLYRGYIDPPGPGYDLAGEYLTITVVHDVQFPDPLQLAYPPIPHPPTTAMTAYNEILYLVYDKDKVVHALDLTDPTLIPPPLPSTPHPSPPDNSTSPKWIVDATDMDATDYDLTFKRRGQEGMTFAEVRGTQHETFVFLGIDPPGKKGKDVIRFGVGEFWECFEERKGKGGKKGKGKKEKWYKKWEQVEEEGEEGQEEEERVEVDKELKKVGEDVQKKIRRGDDYIVKGKPW